MTKTIALLILLLPSAALAQQRQFYDAWSARTLHQ